MDETTFHFEHRDAESKTNEPEEKSLDETEANQTITLVSSDNKRFEVQKSFLKNSVLLWTILEEGSFHSKQCPNDGSR